MGLQNFHHPNLVTSRERTWTLLDKQKASALIEKDISQYRTDLVGIN